MVRIPTKETDLITLAEEMMAGLKNNASTFPEPPIAAKEMNAQIHEFILQRDNVIAAKAAYETAINEKKTSFEAVNLIVKDNAYYCKKVAGKNEAILTMVGLTAIKRKEDEAPGQCVAFKVTGQGEGRVSFEWKRPDNGGTPRAYKIERKNVDADVWEIASMALETKAEANNQTIGEAFEYRVIASNKLGDGLPSNTVTVKF